MVAVCRVGALIWHHAERHRKMTKRFVIPFHFLLLFLAKKAIITKYRTLQTKSVLAFFPPIMGPGCLQSTSTLSEADLVFHLTLSFFL